MHHLTGKKIAILVENGFEQVEFVEPKKALEENGAQTMVVSPQQGSVKAWDYTEWGMDAKVDVPLSNARPEDFDALLLPGGVMNPDRLRMNPQAVKFVRAFFDSGKPVAAICHGPWLLIEAGVAKGRRIAAWPSLKTDLENAGAQFVDQEVVEERNLVTSRKPDDIPAFNRHMIELFAKGGGGQVRRAG